MTRGTTQPVAAAGVVARDDAGRLLLVRRTDDGHWCLPGGRLEPGETWAACARREFREETGCDVELTGLLGIYSDPTTQVHRYGDGHHVQLVGVVFEGVAGARIGSPADDVDASGWFDAGELPGPLLPADVPVVRDALTSVRRPVIG